MNITFLGTTCMVPTKERNHPGILLRFKSEGFLFDCGENMQRQIKIADHKLTEITKIFISHWHGDHSLGLPGVIQSLGRSEYTKKLEIYGPKGTKKKVEYMLKAFDSDYQPNLNVYEIDKEGTFINKKDYKIDAYKLDHTSETIGFVFIEKDRLRINVAYIKKLGIPEGPLLGKLQEGKDITFKGKKVLAKDATYVVNGKRIGYISDTALCKGCYTIAKDCDLLISESSYTSQHEDKASEYKHLTAQQAAQIAAQSNVKKLVLTHLSPRYKNTKEIEDDAKTVFKESQLAFDFLKIKL